MRRSALRSQPRHVKPRIQVKHHGEEKYAFIRKYALESGEADCVISRYYDAYFQENSVVGDNLIHFDLSEELQKMQQNDRKSIVSMFYDDEEIETDNQSVILLTENLANTDVMTWNEQLILYQYLVDYFLDKYSLFIKPHPDDLLYYEDLFENINIVRKRFPAELLPFVFKKLPQCIATASSTAIYGFRRIFKEVLEFNFEFSHKKEFYTLNRYYVALSVIKQYLDRDYTVNLVGVNTCIIDNFYHFCNLGTESYIEYPINEISACKMEGDKKTLWIFDTIPNEHSNSMEICSFMESINDDDVIIFINSSQQFGFYDYRYKSIWNNIEPINIKIKPLINKNEQNVFAGPPNIEEGEEIIYLYSKGIFEMDEVKRELPHVGGSLSANQLYGDKKQIKILEGMLEATEKRLLYYINQERNEK